MRMNGGGPCSTNDASNVGGRNARGRSDRRAADGAAERANVLELARRQRYNRTGAISQSAIIYARGDRLYVRTCSVTVDNIGIEDGDCKVLSQTESDDKIGQAVLEALTRSRIGLATPTQWKAVIDPLLRAAGTKTWSTFAKTAKAIIVSQEAGAVSELTLVPTRNGGNEEGFVPLVSHEIRATGAETVPESIGSFIKALLAVVC